MRTRLLMTFAVLAFTQNAALAAAPPLRVLTTDAAKCEIVYNDEMGERGLLRKCAGAEEKVSKYFALEDTSAPLVESKTLLTSKNRWLLTRWATGSSEELVLLDVSGPSPKIAERVISNAPAQVSVDSKQKKFTVQVALREGNDLTAPVAIETLKWPR